MWQPTERTNIAFSGGQRFFGDTYNALASHRTRLTVWDASYDENMTTFNQQARGFGGEVWRLGERGFGRRLWRGGFGQAALVRLQPAYHSAKSGSQSRAHPARTGAALLGMGLSGSFFDPTNFLTNRLFLQKRFQASFALNGLRNTFVVRGFNMTRQALSPATADDGLLRRCSYCPCITIRGRPAAMYYGATGFRSVTGLISTLAIRDSAFIGSR